MLIIMVSFKKEYQPQDIVIVCLKKSGIIPISYIALSVIVKNQTLLTILVLHGGVSSSLRLRSNTITTTLTHSYIYLTS
jgi:hypothetical protein